MSRPDRIDRLRGLPAPAAGAAMAAVVTAGLTLFDWFVEDEFSWFQVVLQLAVFTVLYSVLVLVTRHRAARPGGAASERAVRSGTLPDDADPGDLRQGLLHTRRSVRRYRLVAPVGAAVLVLCWVLVIDRSSVGDSWWLVPVGCLALAGALFGGAQWQLRRVDRLLAELAARSGA